MTKRESGAERPRVCVLDRGYSAYQHEEEIIEGAGYALDIFRGAHDDREGRIAFSQGAPGLLVRWTEVDDAFLSQLPGLKVICRYGVGYENIDVDAASARGVKVAITKGYGNHSVSDHALSMMLACARDLPNGQRCFKTTAGFPPRLDVMEFCDMNLGIIGLGRIGSTLARKVQSLFARVLAFDPYIADEQFASAGALKTSLESVLAESHIISMHCPLTAETRRMIDWRAFEQMKQRPIIINTARGGIVDEEALLDALHKDMVHSAGLDVFSVEPPYPTLDPLRLHPRVLPTFHYAYYSEKALERVQRSAAETMVRLLRGEPDGNCLNPEA